MDEVLKIIIADDNYALVDFMKKIIFKGCGTAIVTPFLKNTINYDEFEKLIEFQISEGADAIIVCGTTGESSTMTLDEKKYAIRLL